MKRETKNANKVGFKKHYFRHRQMHLALMRESYTAYCLWSFMWGRSDAHDLFCLAENFIMEDTGMGQNTVRDAKRILLHCNWIKLVGTRSQVGKWDTNEYRVHAVGDDPTGAKALLFGKRKNGPGAQKTLPGSQSTINVLPSGARKTFGTVDTANPVLRGEGDPNAKGILGGAGVLPREVPSEARGVQERSDPTRADAAVDATVAPSALQPTAASAAVVDVPSELENLNPKTNPKTAGGNPLRPPCGDMGFFHSEAEVPKEPEVFPEPEDEADACAIMLYRFLRGRQSTGEVQENGEPIRILPNWRRYWRSDFQKILGTEIEPLGVLDFNILKACIVVSQYPKNKMYYIRAQSICQLIDLLWNTVREIKGVFKGRECPYCHCLFVSTKDQGEHEPCEFSPDHVPELDPDLPIDPEDAAEEEAMYASDDLEASFDDDLNYTLPEPFKTPAGGRILPGSDEDHRTRLSRRER